MLGLGVLIGCLILLSEHLFYKYTLPSLRKKPKSSIWKSRNVMFFSQVGSYRLFIKIRIINEPVRDKMT